MPDIPLGLTFEEDSDGFILRRKTPDGAVATIKMSSEELHGLRAQISLWSDRTISRSQVESGSVQAIVAHPIAQVRLLPDALQQNVLLTVAAASGEQMTLSFPLPVADCIAAELSPLLATMRTAQPAKQ